jgi:hypothetical protein
VVDGAVVVRMTRRDELLDKAVAGNLTKEEAVELRSMVQAEKGLEGMDERIRMLIIFGVGAAAGYALPKLLGLDEKVIEVEDEAGGKPKRG